MLQSRLQLKLSCCLPPSWVNEMLREPLMVMNGAFWQEKARAMPRITRRGKRTRFMGEYYFNPCLKSAGDWPVISLKLRQAVVRER